MNNHISARVGERIISVFDEEQSENIVNVMSTVVKNVGQQDGCRLCCGIGGRGRNETGSADLTGRRIRHVPWRKCRKRIL